MRTGPIVHGVLLALVLGFAYQSWTREEAEEITTGDYVVWKKSAASVTAVLYDSERKSVRVEQREADGGDYLWGVVKRSRPAPKKAETIDATEGADTADGTADDALEPAPEMIVTTREFPVGKAGDELIENFATLRALRDLGKLDDERKAKYGLDESKDNLTVLFSGDDQRTLIVGDRVYGGSDRYVLDPESGKSYVISTEVMRSIEGAENALALDKLHDFEDDEVKGVSIETVKGEKGLVKGEVEDENGKRTTWAEAATPDKDDLTIATFLDRVRKLSAREYDPKLDAASLVHLATFRFNGEGEKELGYLELYRQLPEMQEDEDDDSGRPAQPKRTEYWIRTEKTHSLGKVTRMSGERVDRDLVEIFGLEPPPVIEEPTPPPAPPGAHGMPAGANPHGAAPGADPHGHGAAPAADPHGHGAAPAKPASKEPAKPSAAKPAAKPPAKKAPARQPAAKPATATP